MHLLLHQKLLCQELLLQLLLLKRLQLLELDLHRHSRRSTTLASALQRLSPGILVCI